MKFKIALALVFVLGLTASLAIAAPGSVQKRPTGTTATDTTATTTTSPKGKQKGKPACKPTVSLILNGKFVALNSTQALPAFDMTVKSTNKLGKPYKALGTATVLVATTTKITLNGKTVTLDQLQAGDKLNVQARICKKKIPSEGPTAKRVTAKRPAPAS